MSKRRERSLRSRQSAVEVRVEPPAEVREIVATLEKAGFETWCVGGGVRDALLGHPSLDWDLATSATPPEVRKLFRRTIPIGPAFGTIAVLDRLNVKHEITTFRRDVQTDGRHAVVEFGASLDEDLARRDFTINALAYSPTRGTLYDPFRGVEDLERRLVRAVGDPSERMREDWLRALRAIRFAARYEFEIDPATWEAVKASSPFLSRLSAERVRQEIEKTMEQVRRPARAFAMWRDAGALAALVPAIAGISERALAALDCTLPPRVAGYTRRRTVRLSILMSEAAEEQIAASLRALRFSNADVKWISETVYRWRKIHDEMTAALTGPERQASNSAVRSPRSPSDAQIRRWAAVSGRTRVAYVLRLAAAFWAAERSSQQSAPAAERVASVYRRALRAAYRDPIEIADLAIDGSDLERLGFTGPAVGRTLQQLLSRVIEDPGMNTVDGLLTVARGSVGADHQPPTTDH